jgi:hypothetical protein
VPLCLHSLGASHFAVRGGGGASPSDVNAEAGRSPTRPGAWDASSAPGFGTGLWPAPPEERRRPDDNTADANANAETAYEGSHSHT